jgi:elongation factor 1-gamma
LVDHQVSLADLVLAHSLYPYFTLVLDEASRQRIPNLFRWFLFVANIKEVSTVLGKPRLCSVSQKPSTGVKPVKGEVQAKQEENPQAHDKKLHAQDIKSQVQEKTPQTHDKKPQVKEKTPQSQKTQTHTQLKVEEKKPAAAVEESEDTFSSKKKNPLDELPPSNLSLDNFKKDFLNTKEKAERLQKFWTEYDPNGYSIWFLHYNKSSDQGKIRFKTLNLKSNFLQKLEQFRRYTFSVHGVYGAEPDLEVEGVWMWRGTDIPLEVYFL